MIYERATRYAIGYRYPCGNYVRRPDSPCPRIYLPAEALPGAGDRHPDALHFDGWEQNGAAVLGSLGNWEVSFHRSSHDCPFVLVSYRPFRLPFECPPEDLLNQIHLPSPEEVRQVQGRTVSIDFREEDGRVYSIVFRVGDVRFMRFSELIE
jgi:hypothetical protein